MVFGCIEKLCTSLIDLVAKIIIFVISAISLVASLAIIAIMVWLMVGLNVTDMLDVFGSQDVDSVMYAMYAFLGLLFLVSILGILGVCLKSKTLLSFYSMILMFCLLGLTIVALLWFMKGDKLMENAREQMNDTLTYSYQGDFTTSPVSIAWNFIQYELETCGLDGYEDYLTSTWINTTEAQFGTSPVYNLSYPISCCQGALQYVTVRQILNGEVTQDLFDEAFIKSCYGFTDYGNGTYSEDTSARSPNEKGSINEVKDVLKKSIYSVAGVVGAIVLLQLVLIWAGCRLIDSKTFGQSSKADKEKKDKEDGED